MNSFKFTNLDIKLGVVGNRSDTITQYGPFVTGTPTTDANPGPSTLFFQQFIPKREYFRTTSRLQRIFNRTNLDTEHPGVDGGIPYKQDKDPTAYPATVTGTPTSDANPGSPLKFNQLFYATSPYLNFLGGIRGTGRLLSTFNVTNLDVLDGGPEGDAVYTYKQDKDPTLYPKRVTGTPNPDANPGAPEKFYQEYTSQKEYLDNVGEGILDLTFDSTNLDTENRSPNGGIPYKQDKDPTAYPATVTGTPSSDANPGAPRKFLQRFYSASPYLSSTPIRGAGRLLSTFNVTNLDVLDGGPRGEAKFYYDSNVDPTIYPKYVTGTPNPDANPGAPEKFYQEYNPQNEYLNNVGEGILDLTLDSTNFDVENEYPDGGIPYKTDKDPTAPKNDLTTGPPIRNGIPGPFNKFNQIWNPGNTYLSKNPIETENSTLARDNSRVVRQRTSLDNASTFQYESYVRDLNLPEAYRKGSNLLHFITEIDPRNNRLRLKYDVYDITRLDRESPLSGKVLENTNAFIYEGITGGIPYKPDETDPTIYPVTSLGVGSVRGWNVVTGRTATKYTEPYDPPVNKDDRRTGLSNRKPTYLEYIKNFI